ncbi:MAG: hypothetical protein MUF52_01265 [Syntrophobacteraceae bacterium]|nr:hypothetical protein [Syntrophobacteraceae bacterium]
MHQSHPPLGRCAARWGSLGVGRHGLSSLACAFVMGWLLLTGFLPNPLWAQPPQKTEVFFAQGRSMYHPNDRPRSQLEAAQDLMSSGVLQAVAGILGPAGAQSQFGQIQEKILSKKEKYIDGYQLASEGLANGLYQVTGQVTVSRELLLLDLRDAGFQVPAPAQARVGDLVQGKVPRVVPGSAHQELESGRPGRETGPARPMIIWAVSENWESKWVLPDDAAGGGLPPLARCVLESSRGLNWTLRFVPPQSLQMDKDGRIKPEEVLALSRQAGLEKAIIGRAWLDVSQPGNHRVLALLETMDVASGSLQGEIGREHALQGESVEEGILHLAESVSPSMDRILSSGEAMRQNGVSEAPRGLETWTLTIRASHPQSAWEIVRKEIESLFKDAKTTGFEMAASQITVQVEGIQGQAVRDALDGREISPDIPAMRIEGYSEAERSMVVSLGASEETH